MRAELSELLGSTHKKRYSDATSTKESYTTEKRTLFRHAITVTYGDYGRSASREQDAQF